jgi:hypothetical protein
VPPEVALAAAEAPAEIIPGTRAALLGLSSGLQETTVDSQKAEEMLQENTNPQVAVKSDLGSEGAPSGTRTPNPLVKSRLPEVSGGVE